MEIILCMDQLDRKVTLNINPEGNYKINPEGNYKINLNGNYKINPEGTTKSTRTGNYKINPYRKAIREILRCYAFPNGGKL